MSPSENPSGQEPAGAEAGEPAELMGAVYEELHALASAYLRNERVGHTLQTTALIHEAWVSLSRREAGSFTSRSHFYRAAGLTMRRILVDHALKKKALKRGEGRSAVPIEEVLGVVADEDAAAVDVLSLNDALNRLAAEDARKAQVVELRYFAGCTIQETAEALGIGTATVEREWRFARAWLRADLERKGD